MKNLWRALLAFCRIIRNLPALIRGIRYTRAIEQINRGKQKPRR